MAASLTISPGDLSDPQLMSSRTDNAIASLVEHGARQMPASPHVRGADLTALMAFVRSLSLVAGLSGAGDGVGAPDLRPRCGVVRSDEARLRTPGCGGTGATADDFVANGDWASQVTDAG